MDPETVKHLYDLKAGLDRQMEVAEQLQGNDPLLNPISAFVIAGDMLTAERADKMLAAGMPFWDAVVSIGSYGRLGWIVDNYEKANVPLNEVLDRLPDEWVASDPNDMDPKFLKMWQFAHMRNGYEYVSDGKELPEGDPLIIYRGQDENTTFGIAWTTDIKVAEKFARGAGTRQHNRPGVVYMATVPRGKVLAYLTGRGESEVIVDPRDLVEIEPYKDDLTKQYEWGYL